MAIDLGKQIGPLPLGAWIAVVGTGVGIVVWSRSNDAPAAPEEGSLADLEDELQGVGAGPGWVAVPPPSTPPDNQVAPDPVDNEEWARQAITKLIALGYNPADVNQAITKALGGADRLSVKEWALWTQALAVMGPPPYPVQVRPPGSGSGNPNNPPNPPPNSPNAPGWGVRYWVKPGDSLKKIAVKFYGDESKWRDIYQANRKIIGNNPNFLRPGLRLFIPKPTRTGTGSHPPRDPEPQGGVGYLTVRGDTLMGVAWKEYRDASKWREIAQANRGKVPARPRAKLRPGIRLIIPRIGKPPTGNTQEFRNYTVKPGDTLHTIAAKVYGNKNQWEQIYNWNKQKLGGKPRANAKLRAGMVLRVPNK